MTHREDVKLGHHWTILGSNALGTLCTVDSVPRTIGPEHRLANTGPELGQGSRTKHCIET